MQTVLSEYFKPMRSFGVGFEDIVKRLDDMATSTAKGVLGYPPYNIAKIDDNTYIIELAVAGFAKSDLQIEIRDNTLIVTGKTSTVPGTEEQLQYLHKGIADRAFTRQFNLADSIEIKNAELIDGMLKITLENIIPEHKKPKTIPIF